MARAQSRVWLQSNGTNYDVYSARYDAGTWSSRLLMESRTEQTSYVGAGIDTSGRLTLVWTQSDGTAQSVWQRRYAPGGGAPYYTIPANATWRSVANTLYGVDSDAAGSALQAAMPNGTTLTQGAQISGWPSVLQVQTPITVPPYYLVPSTPSTPTWRSIAAVVYGIDSVAAGDALQALMQSAYPTLSVGLQISNLPTVLGVPASGTVPPYYVVTSTNWADVTQAVYGTTDVGAIEELQFRTGFTTLTLNQQLTVPLTLTYRVGGGAVAQTVYRQTDIELRASAAAPVFSLTTFTQDNAGRLASVLSPVVGGVRLETRYAYDADGNVTSVTEDPTGLNRITAMSYDAFGNLLTTRDADGHTVTRTYGTNNEVLTETRYEVPDPDGSGSGVPSIPLTTRFAYDSENHLRFTVSATGRVSEHRYNGSGERTSSLQYGGALYDISGLASNVSIAESTLATWAAAQNQTTLLRTDYAYDFRGNLEVSTSYTETDASGNGSGILSVTRFVYDQRGRLLTTIEARGEPTTAEADDYVTSYVYDGLGRVLSTTSWVSVSATTQQVTQQTTLSSYDDANRRTTVTLANGLVTTSTYNTAGELVSTALGVSGSFGTTSYVYDAAGRLRMTTDPLGVRTYNFYDAAGRLVATVDGDGTLTEFIYDRTSALVKTIRYAVRLDSTTLATLVSAGVPQDVPLATLRDAADGEPADDRIARRVYDAAGRLELSIDEVGAVTSFVYDGAGRVVEERRYSTTVSIAREVDALATGDITLTSTSQDRLTRHFYDADGNEVATLDAAGYLVEYLRDPAGFLVTQIGYALRTAAQYWEQGTLDDLRPADDAEDVRSRFFHDAQGRQIGVLDSESYLTEMVFDVAGHVTSTTRYDVPLDDAGGTATFATLRAAAVAAVTAPTNPAVAHTTTFEYDGLGRVTESFDFEGVQTFTEYDEVGNVIRSTRAGSTSEARRTETRYDELGRVTQELSAQGSALITESMTEGQVNNIWLQYGVQYEYDLGGRRISATSRPDDLTTLTTLYFYDEEGRLRFEVNPLGEVRETRYDAFGGASDSIAYANRISTASLVGGVIVTALTDRVTAAADPDLDSVLTRTYTRRGQLANSESAEGAITDYEYDAFGDNRVRLERFDATRTLRHEYTYDTRGQLVETRWDPAGLNTTEVRTYDAFGRTVSVTDARNATTEFEYDRLGRQLVTEDALGGRSSVSYDAFGRTLTTTDALLNQTTYTYDDDDRTMTLTTPEGVVVVTTHNRHGQTLRVEAAGLATQYLFDANGQVLESFDNLGSHGTTTYDRAGRVTVTTSTSGATTTFVYDGASRVLTRTLASAGDGIELTTEYEYDGQGRVFRVTEDTGRVTETEYDRDGRVQAVIVDPAGLALRTEYDYDFAGHTIETREGVGANAPAAGPRRTVYEFDMLGRRISETVDPLVNDVGLNLVTQYRYDANGNLTRKIDAAGYSTWFVYDTKGQMSYTVDALGGVSEMIHDAAGRVVETRRYATAIDPYVENEEFGDVVTLADVTEQLTTSAQDRATRSVFDGDGREIFTVNALGGVTERTFDANGNVTRTRLYANAIVFGAYETREDVEEALETANNDPDVLAANDRVSFSVYDLRGRAAFAIDGLGAVSRLQYDAAGNVVRTTAFAATRAITEPMTLAALESWAAGTTIANNTANRTTRHWYDGLDRLRFTLDAEGYLKETRYDDEARTEQAFSYAARPDTLGPTATLDDVEAAVNLTAGADVSSETRHDVAGRVTRVYDSATNYEFYDEYTYDSVGNKVSFRNKLDDVWTYEYDANRRLVAETTPDVEITTITAANGTTFQQLFTKNTLTAGVETAGIVSRFAYDSLGNVTARSEADDRPEGRATFYQYDALGRQVRTITPEVGIYVAEVDQVFNERYMEGNFGRQARSSFEVFESLVTSTTYDTLGNAVIGTNTAGSNTYNVYDRLGRLRYTVDAMGFVTEHRYDTFGNQSELIRYAMELDWEPEPPITTDDIAALLVEDAASDRTIVTEYDRLNRAVRVIEPEVLAFEPGAGAAAGLTFSENPTTESEFNAFGQLVRQSRLVDPSTGLWASTYFYYDERGLRTAEVDPLGFVTEYDYDAQGNTVRTTEYARALTPGSWDVSTYGTPPVTTPAVTTPATLPDYAGGYDRITEFEFDSLNRRVLERRVDVVHSAWTGTALTTVTEDAETSYEYDAIGRQISMANPNGAVTLNAYDALGRMTGTAAPARDGGDGTIRTPVLRMRYDAFGNLVEETLFANSPAGTEPFDVTASTNDRTTRTQYDVLDRAIRRQDAVGNNSFVSYTARGEVGREWRGLGGSSGVAIKINEYDELGHLIRETTPRIGLTIQGAIPDDLTFRHANRQYNAFGEVTSRDVTVSYWQNAATETTESDSLGTEYFEYDRAGRMVKTNSGNGVDSVQLYNLAGQITARITSQTRDLRDMSVADANALTTERMRMEMRYDLAGRLLEQRMPSFGVSNPDSELVAIGALLRVDDDILGPNNPDAVHRLDTGSLAYDPNGSTDYEEPFIEPEQPVIGRGGWSYQRPTPTTPGGVWTQDPNYALEPGRYIHWARPPEFTVDNAGRSRLVFEIRPASGGSWTPLRVVALPGNEVGVELSDFVNGEYDYRLTYTRATATEPYAIATGRVVVGATSTLTDTTAATVAGENLTVTAFASETATNTQFLDAEFRIGDFLALPATDAFVYRRVQTGALVEYVVDRLATVAQGGGYYRTASGFVQNANYLPETSRLIRWDAPASGSYTPVFQYRAMGSSDAWQSLTATLSAGVYTVAVGNLADGHYEFTVSYTPTATPAAPPVATANGAFHLEPAAENMGLEIVADLPDDAGLVASIGNRPPGGLAVTGSIVSSALLEDATATNVLFEGTNDVLVTFASSPGPVRIELEYRTLAISAENDPGPLGAGWPSQTRRVSLLLADGTNAASGLHVLWTDPTAYLTTGGISEILAIRVYSVAGDGSSTLRHSTAAADLATLGGTQLSWKAPWNTAVVATFNVRPQGATTWQALAVTRVSGDYTVDVGALAYGAWEYEVTYTLDGVTRAQSTGVFSTQGGRIANVFEEPPGGVYPREAFPPVSGTQTAPVEFTVTSATQVVTGTPMYGPLTTAWNGSNVIGLTWDDLGTNPVRVVVDYTSAQRYAFNHAGVGAPSWETSAVYVPGVLTSRTQEFSSAATGANMSWDDNDAGSVGGVAAVHRVRVYVQNAGVWELRYDRDAAAPQSGTSIYWAVADDPSAVSTFRARAVGTQTWQTLTVTDYGTTHELVDLDGLASGEYEYEIVRTIVVGGNTVTSAATGGRFTLPAAGASVTSRNLGVTQQNAVFTGTNDFGPVVWSESGLRWTQAPQSGDTVVLRTRLAGTSTWTDQSVSGAGPEFTMPVTVSGADVIEFEILYTASGQSTPYLRAGGSLNQAPAVSLTPPFLLMSQTAVVDTQPAVVQNLENLFGLLSWTTLTNAASDTVDIRVQPAGGAWQTLTAELQPGGYVVDLRGLPDAAYRYEIRYFQVGQALPYVFASGTLTPSTAGSGGGLSIDNETVYVQPVVVRTDANTPTSLLTYDRWGNALSSTDAAGNTTNYRYDQSSAVTETLLPSVQVVDTTNAIVQTTVERPRFENHYDLLGRLIATVDGKGNLSRGEYNAANQRVREIAADGSDKAFVYDNFGDMTLSTDQLDFRTRNVYDRMGRLLSREREVQSGGLGSGITAQAVIEQYEYNAAGNRTRERNGLNESTFYSYDVDGSLIRRTTNRGFATDYEYDAFGNKAYERDANSSVMTWTYDAFGHLTAHVDMAGVRTNAEYNEAGLVTSQTSTQGQNQRFEYDEAGHLVRIVDSGKPSSATADVVGVKRVTEYGYDIMGRRALERTVIDGRIHQDSFTTFDALGRMSRVADPDFEVNYSYDAAGNRTRINADYYNHIGRTLGNIQTQDLWYTYDDMNRVLISQGVNSAGTIIVTANQGVSLTYNLKGERTSALMSGEHIRITRTTSGGVETSRTYHRDDTGQYTERYTYDGLGRLLATDLDAPTVTTPQSGFPFSETISIRTSERSYNAASREVSSTVRIIDPEEDSDNALQTHTTTTTYDLDGRTKQQVTTQNGVMVTRVTFGDAVFHAAQTVQTVAVTDPVVREVVRSLWPGFAPLSASGGSGGGGGSAAFFPGNFLSLRNVLPRRTTVGSSGGYAALSAYWSGGGWDAAGNLKSYTVENFKASNGRFKYTTTHTFNYRRSDSYQQIGESTVSWGNNAPNQGSTTRTYNVNNELIQFSDKFDKTTNRYFANNAQGQALTVVQGKFDGRDGRMTPTRAFDNALTRTGNQVKAQYYYFSQGENIGTFGQLTDSEGTSRPTSI